MQLKFISNYKSILTWDSATSAISTYAISSLSIKETLFNDYDINDINYKFLIYLGKFALETLNKGTEVK